MTVREQGLKKARRVLSGEPKRGPGRPSAPISIENMLADLTGFWNSEKERYYRALDGGNDDRADAALNKLNAMAPQIRGANEDLVVKEEITEIKATIKALGLRKVG